MKLELLGKERITNLDQLFRASDIDPKEWQIIKCKINKWDQAQSKRDWSTELIELFQIFAEIEPIHKLLAPDVKQILMDTFSKHVPVIKWPSNKDWPLLAQVSAADRHLGRNEQKKPDIYEKQLYDRNMELFEALLWCKPDKFLFVSLGDMANSEMNHYTSSGKNHQHNNMSWHEMFTRVLNLHNDLIRQFASEIATEVIIVPWNHDRELMKTVWTALEIAFSKSNVQIDNKDNPRKYRNWGDVALAYSHGDGEKQRDRLAIMSQEHWLKKYNYWDIGHFHEREVKQYWPLEVTTIPSPAVQSNREKNQFAHKTAKLTGRIYDKKKWKVKEIYK